MRTGKSPRAGVCGIVVAATVLGAGASAQVPIKRVVWAPVGDQWAQYGLAAEGQLPAGHSEFPMGSCRDRYRHDDIRRLVRSSLDVACRRGVSSLDAMFFYDEAMFAVGVPQVPNIDACPPFERDTAEPDKPEPRVQGLIDVSTDWVEAVEDFNSSPLPAGCERLSLRIRLVPTPATLFHLRRGDPATYAALPPPLECDEHDPTCDPARPYRALVTVFDPAAGAFTTTRTSEVLDLGVPAIRQSIGTWLGRALQEVGRLAPTTPVEMVSLALDVGGESSLFSSRGITSFSGTGGYESPATRPQFFRERQALLRQTYAVFAAAARTRGVPAAAFYQSWVLDDTLRGAFDLAELVEGTGISVLHHTVWPRNVFDDASTGLTELEHRMLVATAATAARRLGLQMDTEFSWPWYYPKGTFFSGGIYRWLNEGAFGGPWGTHHVGDFDGDGLSDLLFLEANSTTGEQTFYVALSNGAAFVQAGGPWLSTRAAGELLGIADFDGDGLQDLLFRTPGTVDALSVSVSTGTGFGAPVEWAHPGHFRSRPGRCYLGDFNGDGRADVLFQSLQQPIDNSLEVSLASPGAFAAPTVWVPANSFGGSWGLYLVGDFNGDHRADLLFLEPGPPEPNTIHVSLSTGSGFFGPGSGVWKESNGFGGAWGRYYVGNFDGQGGDDLMFFEPSDRSVHVAVARDGFFMNSGVWLDPNHFGENADGYVPGDYTGYTEVDAAGNRVAHPDGLVDLGYLDAARGEFHVAKASSGESGVYNGYLRSDDNARSFRSQAVAGFKFGADGIVYANWTTGDLRTPPASEAWRAIIGPVEPSTDHLDGPGGLRVAPDVTPLPSARKALYLSSLGKMACEDAGSCRFPDYLGWFRDFDLLTEIELRQVDVLTDRMVREGPLGQYDTIFLPYETSFVIDDATCARLVKHPNVRRQVAKHGTRTLRFRICP